MGNLQFIVSYKHLYPIEKMCSVLKVSRSSCYRWFSGGPSNRFIENSLFTDLIKEVFDLSSQTKETYYKWYVTYNDSILD